MLGFFILALPVMGELDVARFALFQREFFDHSTSNGQELVSVS
jgi:hypothetical protein